MKIRASLRDGQEVFNESFSDFPVIIGRQAPAGMVLPFPGVSAQHAELTVEGKKLLVRDLGSRNGTYVGEERIILKAVSLPCKVRIGINVILEIEGDVLGITDGPEPAALASPEGLQQLPSKPEGVGAKRPARPQRPATLRWDTPWTVLDSLDPRLVAVLLASAVVPLGILRWVMGSQGALYSFAFAFGALLAITVLSLLGAALLALPGWLIRKSYNPKPLFYGGVATAILLLLHKEFLLPLGMAETWGPVARLFSVPILLINSVVFVYLMGLSTFPHHWGRRLGVSALVIGTIIGLFAAKDAAFQDREAVLKAVFTAPSSPSRVIAGAAVAPSDFSEEMKLIERELLED
jgi:hypothetical protein